MPENPVHLKLEQVRRSLLDLSRRNRLLNFRPRGHTSLQIVDEVASEVYRSLVNNQQAMQFLAMEESELFEDEADRPIRYVESDADGFTEFKLPTIQQEASADRHTDLFLQTSLKGDKLQKRLLRLSRESESALQERGTNILYLALGFLEWVDRNDSRIAARAPILLVPVELMRPSANTRFKLSMFDDDIQVNPCLVELCRQHHRIEFPEFDPEADQPLDQLLADVQSCIEKLPSWSVIHEIHLGLFSFAKLMMYLDMDPKRWSGDKGIANHSIVQRLLGFGQIDNGGWDPLQPEELDDRITPHETFQVLDADSSQQAAVIAAKNSCSMVIEGPPGTGKSQTITNIIAECLSEGKTVLFVAEKSAALEVVQRRLTSVQLQDFVVELHSRKASKKLFMEELRRSLQAEYHPPGPVVLDADQLLTLRKRLNRYVRALHGPIEPLKISPFNAMGRCTQLERAPESPFVLDTAIGWDRSRLQAAEELIHQLSVSATRIGDRSKHVWRGIRVTDVAFSELQQLPAMLRMLEDALKQTESSAQHLANKIGQQIPATRDSCVKLVALVQELLKAPKLQAEQLDDERWDRLSSQVNDILLTGRKLSEMRGTLAERWKPEAEELEWGDVLKRQRSADSAFRWLRPTFWSDRSQIRKYALESNSREASTLIRDLESFERLSQLRDSLRQVDPVIEGLFGALWQQDQSDWPKLKSLTESIRFFRKHWGANPESVDRIRNTICTDTGRKQLYELAKALVDALKALQQAWYAIRTPLEVDAAAFLGGKPDETSFSVWHDRVKEAAANVEQLRDWTGYLKATKACAKSDTKPFVDWVDAQEEPPPPDSWLDTYRKQFYRLWLDEAVRSQPFLADFRGEEHEYLVEQFRQLDRKWLELSQARLAAQIAKRRPRVGYAISANSDLGRLEAELRRKRRIKPIRQLLASNVAQMIQQIKPCFMMSPISVAQYLAPGKLEFDVVIFDEASQVEVADAVGAISRGSQLILVGDEKQLPPTNFFSTIDDSEAEEDETDNSLPVEDLESILSAGYTALPHRFMLKWHYRSRHHSLIHFSNSEFYANGLRVFPSPVRDRNQLGLSFRHVVDGVYDRGKSRCNLREAALVAEAAIEHARNSPDWTLGIGAFSKAQQTAIEDHVEQLRRQYPDVEAFFNGHEGEPFFVKNLETIQGDERDVILLSVGYGPDSSGRVHMSFGPINADGGWRRLNVLVSRARQRCVVFSSMLADQIRVTPESPRGVVALKRYLDFARSGEMPLDSTPSGGHDTAFEESVCRSLQLKGWEIDSQVGCAGYSIDLAVVDPRAAGRYLVGIECDGATYHSSATARDRDRIRQSVLKDLGWDILRVWSTDWFRQPETTLTRLDSAMRQLLNKPPESEPRRNEPHTNQVRQVANLEGDHVGQSDRVSTSGKADSPPTGIARYRRYEGKKLGTRAALMKATVDRLAELVSEITYVEGPIHQNELVRIAASLYRARAKGEARDHLAKAVNAAVRHQWIHRHGLFLWPNGMTLPPVRWRGDDEAPNSAEHIPVEEVAEAVVWVVSNDGGIPRDDLSSAAIRVMGFKRVGSLLSELGDKAIDYAITSGRVQVSAEGRVVIASGVE